MIRTYWYAVTFEFDGKAPEVVRGSIDVPNPRLGVRRALEAAQKARPNRHFSSLVVVLDTVPPDTPPPSVDSALMPQLKRERERLDTGVSPWDGMP